MGTKIVAACLSLILGVCSCISQAPPAGHLAKIPLTKNAQEVFDLSMQLLDASYDAQAHLVLHPSDGGTHVRGKYMVRESTWYALGLLMRNHGEDTQRAQEILASVLKEQYLDKSVKWYGTFRRTPEEPLPGTGDPAFSSYDPNWRHFIGTILEMILLEYPDRLPGDLKANMYAAIDRAVDGEIHDGRLVPSYSNIALMYGALWDFAAVHDGNADWRTGSAAWTAEVYRLFSRHGTFNEYNAPTYYGVDLYGLALWREYGSTPLMRSNGRAMEAALWNDLADFYQPRLRNMAGPFDRVYGMDMSSYVSPTGVWIRTLLDGAHAALPEKPALSTYQVADTWFAPQITLLQTHIPPQALAKLRTFAGPHLVKRQIDDSRTATAWVGERAMWGGEQTRGTKEIGISQFVPVTAHWIMPSGQIGWLKLTHAPMLDAVADQNGVSIETNGDVTFRVFAGKEKAKLDEKNWILPALDIAIQSDGSGFTVSTPLDCADCQDVVLKGVHSLRMTMKPGS